MKIGKRLLTLVACLSVVFLSAGCDNDQQKEARHIKRGNALMEEGELDKARVEYKNALKLQPTHAEPYYRLGLVDEQKGDLRSAFSNYMAAEQQNARYYPAALKVAQYYLAAGQHEEAQKRISAALADDPKNAEAHAIAAALLLRQKKFDEAEIEARQALDLDPTNVSACSALMGAYSAQNQFDKAISTINEGIGRNPDNLALALLRVMLYEKAQDIPKVAESYTAVFKLKPDTAEFRADLASIYVNAKMLDEAEAFLRDSVKERPKNWDFKRLLVVFLNKNRSSDVAEAEIKKLIEDYPSNDDLYFWLADLYASNDSMEKAVELLNKIVERRENNPPGLNARTFLARIDIKRGNQDSAKRLITTVLSKEPDNRSALLVKANLAFINGYYEDAVSDLRSILRNAPNDREAMLLLGETYFAQNHADLAIDTIKKLIDLDPGNSAARVRLAQIVSYSGDKKQAMDIISLVTKTAPKYAIGWEAAARIAIEAQQWLPANEAIQTLGKIEGQHLTAAYLEGQVAEKTGKTDEAIMKYTEVINADPASPLSFHAIVSLSDLYIKLGRADASAAFFSALKSEVPMVNIVLGKAYIAQKKYDDAATVLDKAIESKAPIADPYIERAVLYIKENKSEQAIDILKRGMDAVPNDFRAPLTAASMLSERGNHEDARKIYEDVLARNPGIDIAANNLAELIADYEYEDEDALNKARAVVERFSGSTNPLLLDTLGWVYYRQGDIKLAQTILERAIGAAQGKVLPQQIHYHYGMILLKSGNKKKAMEELKLAVTGKEKYPGIEEAKKLVQSK